MDLNDKRYLIFSGVIMDFGLKSDEVSGLIIPFGNMYLRSANKNDPTHIVIPDIDEVIEIAKVLKSSHFNIKYTYTTTGKILPTAAEINALFNSSKGWNVVDLKGQKVILKPTSETIPKDFDGVAVITVDGAVEIAGFVNKNWVIDTSKTSVAKDIAKLFEITRQHTLKIQTNLDNIGLLQTEQTKLYNDVENSKRDIKNNKVDIKNNRDNIGNVEIAVDNVKDDVKKINTDITNLWDANTKQDSKILAVEQDIDKLDKVNVMTYGGELKLGDNLFQTSLKLIDEGLVNDITDKIDVDVKSLKNQVDSNTKALELTDNVNTDIHTLQGDDKQAELDLKNINGSLGSFDFTPLRLFVISILDNKDDVGGSADVAVNGTPQLITLLGGGGFGDKNILKLSINDTGLLVIERESGNLSVSNDIEVERIIQAGTAGGAGSWATKAELEVVNKKTNKNAVDINSLKTIVSANTTSITSNGTKINKNSDDIVLNDSAIKKNNGLIVGNTTAINNNDNTIHDLGTQVQTLNNINVELDGSSVKLNQFVNDNLASKAYVDSKGGVDLDNKTVATAGGNVKLKNLNTPLVDNTLLVLTRNDLRDLIKKEVIQGSTAAQSEIALQAIETVKEVNGVKEKLWYWQDITSTYISRKWAIKDIGKRILIELDNSTELYGLGMIMGTKIISGSLLTNDGSKILYNFSINLDFPSPEQPNFITSQEVFNDGKKWVHDYVSNKFRVKKLEIMERLPDNSIPNNYVGNWSTAAVEAEFMAAKTEVKDKEFENERGITEITMPEVLKIGAGAFDYEQLTKLTLPKVVYISDSAFEHSVLKGDFNAPLLKFVGSASFRDSNFDLINIINTQVIGANAFEKSKTTELDVSGATTIDNQAFIGIVNATSTTVSIRNMFNNDYDKDRIFGKGNWDKITFAWL